MKKHHSCPRKTVNIQNLNINVPIIGASLLFIGGMLLSQIIRLLFEKRVGND